MNTSELIKSRKNFLLTIPLFLVLLTFSMESFAESYDSVKRYRLNAIAILWLEIKPHHRDLNQYEADFDIYYRGKVEKISISKGSKYSVILGLPVYEKNSYFAIGIPHYTFGTNTTEILKVTWKKPEGNYSDFYYGLDSTK